MPLPCPCNPKTDYAQCCGVFHEGTPAPTPQALMRSRYSAYVLRLSQYVKETWHANTRPTDLDLRDDTTAWLRLDVKRFCESGDDGEVEFVAVSKHNGRAQRLHETSRFVRERGRWFYVDGTIHEP
jgi:SEC-C motif domain protein